MTVALRDYQARAVEAVRDAYRAGARAPLLVLPTGGGKTVVFSHIGAAAAARGKRVLVLAHRKELIRQASAKLCDVGVQHGIIAPGFTPTRDMMQVASVQTLAGRLGDPRYLPPNLIVVDEGHHAVAGQWGKVLAAYPDARLLVVTATPERLDGRGLGVQAGGPCDALICGPSVAELTAGGFLVPARVFAPAEGGPDLSGVATKGGDYAAGALAAAMDKPGLTGDAAAHYARLAPGLPAVAFCASVKNAEHTAEQFRAAGWRAVAASGQTPGPERDAAIAGLATGAVQVLCAAELISEGLDIPGTSVVILLRPTKSLGLYLQQVGRGLRPATGKTHLLILDHAGNCLRHGMPEADQDWSLDGRKKRPKVAVAVRQCPGCFAVHAPAPACPSCGHTYAAAPAAKAELEIREGNLQEVDGSRFEAIRKAKLHELLKTAKTEDQLREIAKAKGYKRGWIQHILAARGQRQSVAA
jgi:superfamily II DNA or RNA helicase